MNKLHLSPEAQNDLMEIKEYISEELENPKAAISIVRNITKSIGRLREYAFLGTSLSAIAEVDSDYRYLLSDNYMVFYRVTGKNVYVDRVLYARRDYLRILIDQEPFA